MADLTRYVVAGACWLWIGKPSSAGDGRTSIGSRTDGTRRNEYAHRAVYEALVGSIPKGLELDHLCRNRLCCNPDHLEPVTHRENTMRSPVALAAINARKTHCRNSHSLADAYLIRGRERRCRTCRHDRYATEGR